jgi:hypothetical protein
MVGSGVHGADAVNPSRQSGSNVGCKFTTLSRLVKPLEKGENSWVGDFRGIEGRDQLNGNVTVGNESIAL